MQGTWQTTGGGSGLLELVAAIVVIAVVASIAGPVVAAVGELVHILLIAVAVIGGLAAVGLVAFIAYRVRHRRSVSGAARAARPPALVRAARPLPPRKRSNGRRRSTCISTASLPRMWPPSSRTALVSTWTASGASHGHGPGRMDEAPAVVVAALRQLGTGVHGGRGCRILAGGGVRRPPGRVTAHAEHRGRPARD
jgi:hypothetical protein